MNWKAGGRQHTAEAPRTMPPWQKVTNVLRYFQCTDDGGAEHNDGICVRIYNASSHASRKRSERERVCVCVWMEKRRHLAVRYTQRWESLAVPTTQRKKFEITFSLICGSRFAGLTDISMLLPHCQWAVSEKCSRFFKLHNSHKRRPNLTIAWHILVGWSFVARTWILLGTFSLHILLLLYSCCFREFNFMLTARSVFVAKI